MPGDEAMSMAPQAVMAALLTERLHLTEPEALIWAGRILGLHPNPIPGVEGSERYLVGELVEAVDILGDWLGSGHSPRRSDLFQCLRMVRRPKLQRAERLLESGTGCPPMITEYMASLGQDEEENNQ